MELILKPTCGAGGQCVLGVAWFEVRFLVWASLG